MRYAVERKQPNSKMCLVCGLQNSLGLKASFYELENGELLGCFTPQPEQQGYPDRLHGGVIAAILDEAIERAGMIGKSEDTWGVTVEFTTRFKKPVPLGQQLRVRARITRERSRSYEGESELLLADGTVAAKGSGRFLKIPKDRFDNFDELEQEWTVTRSDDDPREVEL